MGIRSSSSLLGRRIVLRPLRSDDFLSWQRVRRQNADWLVKWEPSRPPGSPDVVEDYRAFDMRCTARDKEWKIGLGYGFGVFLDGEFVGEVNLNSVQRGPFQNAYVGYWVAEAAAGQGIIPEAVVLILQFAFEQLHLHRIQISIVPRNKPSLRVVEKLGLRCEGTAERYLEINGLWEDHSRYAITAEEWDDRRGVLIKEWL